MKATLSGFTSPYYKQLIFQLRTYTPNHTDTGYAQTTNKETHTHARAHAHTHTHKIGRAHV